MCWCFIDYWIEKCTVKHKNSNINFNETLSSGRRVDPCGRTDGLTYRSYNRLYKEPTRCNFRQYSFLLTATSTLYMFFRRFLCPSSGVLKTVVAATGACQDIQGRSTTPFHIITYILIRIWNSIVDRPWTYLLDTPHPDSLHAPVAATTVSSIPDDGRRKRPKHVECTCSG
jgi:hypothetical protein